MADNDPVTRFFEQIIAGMTGKDYSIVPEREEVDSKLRLLAEYSITSVEQLDKLAETAFWRDTFRFILQSGIEYCPFAANDAIQVTLSGFVTEFGKLHGATSAEAILLAIISNVAIPSIGSTVVERGIKHLGPTYGGLPNASKYQRPGIKNNPDFVPIIMMPLANFIIGNDLFSCISTLLRLPKASAWAKPAVGVAASLKQTYEVWKALRGKRKELGAKFALRNGEQRFRQLWMEKAETEIRVDLESLFSPTHIALQAYFHRVFHELVVKTPHNVTAALVDPGTVATAIALAPSAVLSHLGSSATDPTTVLAWNILAGVVAIGIPGTGVGMTNQAFWKWVLQKATLDRWSPEEADKFADFVQKSTKVLAKATAKFVKNRISKAPGVFFNTMVAIRDATVWVSRWVWAALS